MDADRIVVNKLKEHSRLSSDDIAEIKTLSFTRRELAGHEDLAAAQVEVLAGKVEEIGRAHV
mgnify:CR=1 FL=1